MPHVLPNGRLVKVPPSQWERRDDSNCTRIPAHTPTAIECKAIESKSIARTKAIAQDMTKTCPMCKVPWNENPSSRVRMGENCFHTACASCMDNLGEVDVCMVCWK